MIGRGHRIRAGHKSTSPDQGWTQVNNSKDRLDFFGGKFVPIDPFENSEFELTSLQRGILGFQGLFLGSRSRLVGHAVGVHCAIAMHYRTTVDDALRVVATTT